MLKLSPHLDLVLSKMKDRDQRSCNPNTIVDQTGKMTIFACAGSTKNVHVVRNKQNESCGIIMWLGTNRATEIVLDWDDTYTLRRYRIIVSGKNAGAIITEAEINGVYCDQLTELVYSISCWK
ncbi:MAG: hypothetical protein EBT80_00550 [Chitinophagales bacterium]|nr:hypothetical protein [Chitinophagales bacterium]